MILKTSGSEAASQGAASTPQGDKHKPHNFAFDHVSHQGSSREGIILFQMEIFWIRDVCTSILLTPFLAILVGVVMLVAEDMTMTY